MLANWALHNTCNSAHLTNRLDELSTNGKKHTRQCIHVLGDRTIANPLIETVFLCTFTNLFTENCHEADMALQWKQQVSWPRTICWTNFNVFIIPLKYCSISNFFSPRKSDVCHGDQIYNFVVFKSDFALESTDWIRPRRIFLWDRKNVAVEKKKMRLFCPKFWVNYLISTEEIRLYQDE